MSVTVCFWLAAAVFLGSVLLAVSLLRDKRERGNVLTPLNVLFAGVMVTAVLLFLPAYLHQEAESSFQGLKGLAFSLYSAIRLFAADGDYDVIVENISGGELASWYVTLCSVLMVMAPALTFGVVLSFFSNLSANLAYLLSYFKETYIFSELNERSLTLAADLKRKNASAAVVFTNVVEAAEDSDRGLQDRAGSIGAICFKKDILAANFGFHTKNRGLWFFAISENGENNLSRALRLIECYGDRENSHLYVFSTGAESEALLTSAQGRAMKVRRVDEVESLINRSLYDEGHLLFAGDLPEENGEKKITAVVVGMGKHGTAMVKALTWFCQMDGYRVEIHAFDQDTLAEDKFRAQCPELMDSRYNGVSVPGEPRYKIQIHSGLSVETATFAEEIHNLDQATYVLVALGSDAQNIRTAMQLRTLFEQCGAKPRIQAIVYSSEKREALDGLHNFKGQPYDIEFIGDLQSSYSADVVIDSELEEDALKRHLRWGKESEFWGFEYNYRSSVALAIHSKAKRMQGIPGAMKPDNELTEAERLALEVLEHRRWNAYMRSQGYIYSGSPNKSTRNDLGKMHHDLIPYGELSEEEKRKDSKAASK